MDGLKDLVIPFAIAILSAFTAAIFAIKLRFSSSEEEAMNDIKNLGKTLITYCFAAWLLYDLLHRGVSPEPIARAEILLMILDAFSLVLILGYYIVKKILGVLKISTEVSKKHADLTHRLVSLQINNNKNLKPTDVDEAAKNNSTL